MISTASLLQLDCEIVLPDGYKSKAKASRQMIDPNEDRRRFPRRDCPAVAALKYEHTFPTLRRPDKFHRIVIRNVSRGGVGFLHSEEMFPHENAFLVFSNGTQRHLQIKRCRRIGPKCYEVGGEFDTPLNNLDPDDWV